ncbi:DNA polymerase zeta [Exophiala xenobiotica]|nr:DNA polymerase zeta [Exophiala xenobiotica]KAK5293083.1 DNA polymerase zeta [Exophiala xenobiotica]KAK5484684.1 DNA polymerase zeta [Exophiala xenobiotica]
MPMDTFRVRLNCIDHYQAVPFDEFDPLLPRDVASQNARDRPPISVIRVFGATETGQKVLMHIHGALQYTYIEYSGSLAPEDVDVAIRTLQLSIDHALAVSYRKNIYEGKHRYVGHISLVKGVPFYGYHVGYKYYLKIYLLNPLHMTRLADLLRDGAVMKRVLQPYESHMQYLAQWMCDYNLYGCGYIECARVKFRSPVPQYLEMSNPLHQWHDHSISPDCISDDGILPKQSHCELEVDVHVKDILNRQNVEARSIHHDFIERLDPIPADAKLVQSMAGLWKDETRRRKLRMGLKDPKSSPFPPEVLISMSADPRNTSAGGWIHEEEYRERLGQLAVEEHENSDRRKISFDTFVRPTAMETSVQTALESVEDLYPDKLGRRWSSGNGRPAPPEEGPEQALVDEARAENVADASESDPSSEEALAANEASLEPAATMHDSRNNGIPIDQVSSPISSSEYQKLGIRPAGDVARLDEDAFEVPEEYVTRKFDISNGTKRFRFANAPTFQPRKRRRRLIDEENVLPDITFSGSEEDPDFATDPNGVDDGTEPTEEELDGISVPRNTVTGLPPTDRQQSERNNPSQERSNSVDLSQQSTLSFPTVKNPHDPNTGLRLTQKSNGSQKSPQTDSDKQPTYAAMPETPFKSVPGSSQQTLIPPTTGRSNKSAQVLDFQLQGLRGPVKDASLLIYQSHPPSLEEVRTTMWQQGLPDVLFQEAYYSNEDDVPEQARSYAGREFKLESNTVPYLPDFDPTGTSAACFGRRAPVLVDVPAEQIRDNQRRKRCTVSEWVIADTPPRKVDVLSWLREEQKAANQESVSTTKPSSSKKVLSQVDGPTQKNRYGFKYAQKQPSTSVQHETQYMSIMALEVHVNTRGSLAPNPDEDAVACVFWCVQTDDEDIESKGSKEGIHKGILTVADEPHKAKKIGRNVPFDVEEEVSELDLLTRLVDIVRLYDPDILTGYEVHNSSWGYLIERARVKYDLNYCDELSRMKSQSHGRFGKDDDRWGFNHTSTIRVTGRHTINIWRAMRGELNLLQYTMENVVYHLLHQRIPHYSFADLTKWYKSKNPRDLAKVIDYFSNRVEISIQLLEANELVPRTSEQARLLGVDWFSVISRGSQFKVESLMFRIAKPENFILVSPSRRQVGGQNALECLPLVMEPQSNFYTSPMLVLDFQSLYPSVMIAYNYCYSTFLGRVVSWRGTNKMGFTDYRREPRLLELLKDYINIAPNGIMYAKPEIRKSLLAKMLSEILETRVMVKSGMKVDKDDKTLQRLLNNRQLALKLIANVTYGYTSASFSGRMPCSEIADSIVQTGRETLEKAIALIHSVERWGAEVVYGDTDSLFVYLKGRTREQAFDIGEEIANTITKMNPRPVKLKFEKVYHPCVLLAKKRYVGFKYESRNQTVPEFDAKGIETVRRDGTPAEQKIEETALKVLFRTSDLSQVKSFFQAQCAKIMRGKVSIQDFCFAREVKLGTYSDKGPPPPGALISARKMVEDPRLEPQYGERVPYVVITGGPGARLIDRCVAPEVLLNDAHSELDAEYYISKNIIPPLERIFNLVGANVRQWYDEMPKYQRIRRVEAGLITDGKDMGLAKKTTLESYMKSSTCLVCLQALDTESALCSSCLQQSSHSLLELRSRLVKAERNVTQLAKQPQPQPQDTARSPQHITHNTPTALYSMESVTQHENTSAKLRRIGQGFCGSVWAAEGGTMAMKREDGGPGRSLLNDYNMHKLVLETASQAKVSVCVPRWPHFVKNSDSRWWDMNLARFPTGYTTCNVLCAERIPPLPQEVRNRLIDRYCPPASIATIKANDADRDCLVRPYLGRRKIQNEARRGRNFFSLRNYPLHLNQAEDLDLPITMYAHAMAEMLAMLHWTAKIDANDIEFVLGGVQSTQTETDRNKYTHDILGTHSLWVLDFDCCKPLTMDDAGIEQAAYAFLRNDPYFPRPAANAQSSTDSTLWSEFGNRYLACSRNILVTDHGGSDLNLPEKFIARVEKCMNKGRRERTCMYGVVNVENTH